MGLSPKQVQVEDKVVELKLCLDNQGQRRGRAVDFE